MIKNERQISIYFLMAVGYTFLLTILLLVPFDFYLPFRITQNNVKWLTGTNGVLFSAAGTIRSSSLPGRLYDDLVSGTGMTLEIWMMTKNDQQEGPARIVSYSKDTTLRNFTLGQQQQDLIMRLRTTETNLNGTNPHLSVEKVFYSDTLQHIVVTYNFSEETVYVDGQFRQRAPIPGRFSNWDRSYVLLFGNETMDNRPWLGQLFLVAVYNRALSEEEIWKNYSAGRVFDPAIGSSDDRVSDGLAALYLFTEGQGDQVLDRSGRLPPVNLQIPGQLQITYDEFLSPPYKELQYLSRFHVIIEGIGNIIIFIPIGFLFHSVMTRRYRSSLKITAVVFILGILLTLSIESTHYFVISKNSTMTDVIHNTVGAALGIAIDKSRTKKFAAH